MKLTTNCNITYSFPVTQNITTDILYTHDSVEYYGNKSLEQVTFYGKLRGNTLIIPLFKPPCNILMTQTLDIMLPDQTIQYINYNATLGLISLNKREIVNVILPVFESIMQPLILVPRQAVFESIPHKDVVCFRKFNVDGNGDIWTEKAAFADSFKDYTYEMNITMRDITVEEVLGFMHSDAFPLLNVTKFVY